jgi:hypothetical protein
VRRRSTKVQSSQGTLPAIQKPPNFKLRNEVRIDKSYKRWSGRQSKEGHYRSYSEKAENGPDEIIVARYPAIYTIEEVKRRSFVNCTQDRALHVEGHEWFATTGNRRRPRCQWGPGPPISHADQLNMPQLLRKAEGRTHDSMIRWRQKKCVAHNLPLVISFFP